MAQTDEKADRFLEVVKQKNQELGDRLTQQEVRDFVKQKELEKEWKQFER